MELEPKIRNYHIRDSNHIKLSYPTTLYNKQQMTAETFFITQGYSSNTCAGEKKKISKILAVK